MRRSVIFICGSGGDGNSASGYLQGGGGSADSVVNNIVATLENIEGNNGGASKRNGGEGAAFHNVGIRHPAMRTRPLTKTMANVTLLRVCPTTGESCLGITATNPSASRDIIIQ